MESNDPREIEAFVRAHLDQPEVAAKALLRLNLVDDALLMRMLAEFQAGHGRDVAQRAGFIVGTGDWIMRDPTRDAILRCAPHKELVEHLSGELRIFRSANVRSFLRIGDKSLFNACLSSPIFRFDRFLAEMNVREDADRLLKACLDVGVPAERMAKEIIKAGLELGDEVGGDVRAAKFIARAGHIDDQLRQAVHSELKKVNDYLESRDPTAWITSALASYDEAHRIRSKLALSSEMPTMSGP